MATILPFPVRPAPASVAHSADVEFADALLAKVEAARPWHRYDRQGVIDRIAAILSRAEAGSENR